MVTKLKKPKFNMYFTLILFALIPMICASIIISAVLSTTSSKELKQTTHNALLSVIKETGTGFDEYIANSEETVRAFTKAPIVIDYLKNPDDAELAAKAQAYTVDFFGELDDWEGIYIADWNSKVLTHPAPPVVGKVMREGDRLTELQNAMLESNGIYNTGIITSPASGELIVSMYAPVYDEKGKPLGYVGAGTFINGKAQKFSDVSSLNTESAYIYFVSPDGIMLSHPNVEKIGQPVENAAVKNIISKLESGVRPDPECVEYEYKGAMKYAAYYIGTGDYIAVLTADESDVLSTITTITKVAVGIALALILIFSVVALIIARLIATPLKSIADTTSVLASGDISGAEITAVTHIDEIKSIVKSAGDLKDNLSNTINEVKQSVDTLTDAIADVDNKTEMNAESISQINSAIEEVSQTSQSVSESAQTLAEKADALGDNISDLNDNVRALHKSSKDIKAANIEAADYMETVLKSSTDSVEAVNTIAKEIEDTNEAVNDIQSCVSMINEIASETKLLSLNASIEAARAGDAGRGFAVVAQNIKQLAESSSDNVEKITNIINKVTNLSKKSVAEAKKVQEIIDTEQKYISDTQSKFEILSQSVESSIVEIESISEKTSRLDVIKADLTNATADLGAISEELGASAEEVSASCHTVSAACADTRARTEEMRAINDTLANVMDFFK